VTALEPVITEAPAKVLAFVTERAVKQDEAIAAMQDTVGAFANGHRCHLRTAGFLEQDCFLKGMIVEIVELEIQPFPIDAAPVLGELQLARGIRDHAQDNKNIHGLSSDGTHLKRPAPAVR